MMQDKENEKEKKNDKRYLPAVKSRRGKNKTEIEEIFQKTMQMNIQIDAKLQEIEYWRAFASNATVIFRAAGMSKGSSKKRSKVEEYACKIADIEESLKDDMDELIGLKEKAMSIIDRIKIPEYRSLLIQRYLFGKKWEEVADFMGYSYVHTVHRLHPRALEKINEIGNGE